MVAIVVANPPNFDEIDARFKIAGKPVIFAYGQAIYNPKGLAIPPELVAHEQVHLLRQAGDPEGWWRRYIDDDAFRLDEEVHAHRAEYRSLIAKHGDNRNNRRRVLAHVALRLCNPVYGKLVAVHEAKKLIAS